MVKAYKSLSLWAKLAIILGIIATISVLTVLIALASSGPVIDNLAPAAEAKIPLNTTFKISFTATDLDTIDSSTAQIKLNGISRPAYVVYPDGDNTCATIQSDLVNSGVLRDINNIWVSVSDALGNTSVAEWVIYGSTPPTISDLRPANGSTITYTALPQISARVTDSGGIDDSSIVLKIDGAKISHTFNSSTGIVSGYPPTPLATGGHVAYLEVKDKVGNMNSASWSFNVLQEGTANFSSETPTAGSITDTSTPTISVFVSDTANLSAGTIIMLANGKKVNATFAYQEIGGHWEEGYDTCGTWYRIWVAEYDYTKVTISYKPAMLPDATTTVAVSISNVDGKSSAYTWSFGVRAPPQISEPYPVNTMVSTDTPTISARVTDNSMVSSIKMLVDSTEVAASFNPTSGIVSYTPSTPLENDAEHTVTVTAVDGVGLSSSLTWKFTVQIYPDMPVSNNCTDCHSGYPVPKHPMTNCDGCHGGNAPIEDCRICHGNWQHGPEFLGYYPCNYCHNSTYSYKIPIHPADASYHNTTTSMEDCRPCHVSALTREHYRHTDATGKRYDCNTCHASTRADVKAAIANKQKNCDACHNVTSGGHSVMHNTKVLDNKCTTCHINNLTDEHLNNPTTQTKTLDCGTCHDSVNPRILGAINANNKHCAACHSQGHNMSFAEARPSDIPLYSGFKWSAPLYADTWAGESWVPDEFVATGKVLISSRRTDVTGDDIWNFYRTKMSVEDTWTLTSAAPEAGSNHYSVTFTKGSRKVMIWFYGGETHFASSPHVPSGYRVEVLYK
ncbi:MAG: hypothetical protein IBX64_04615 [Actinobacteria bacterium]|nr:hypothetical protein [Actinomycetota bacterium]